MVRHEDVTGISGTGVIAEGTQYESGKCTLAWLTVYKSIGVYDSIEELKAIHGHGGKTDVVFEPVVSWHMETSPNVTVTSVNATSSIGIPFNYWPSTTSASAVLHNVVDSDDTNKT